jgi:transposase
MNIHKNARLTPRRREEMALAVLEGRLSKAGAGVAFGVSAKIVARWVQRYKIQGRAGMVDRSSRPHRLRSPVPQVQLAQAAWRSKLQTSH